MVGCGSEKEAGERATKLEQTHSTQGPHARAHAHTPMPRESHTSNDVALVHHSFGLRTETDGDPVRVGAVVGAEAHRQLPAAHIRRPRQREVDRRTNHKGVLQVLVGREHARGGESGTEDDGEGGQHLDGLDLIARCVYVCVCVCVCMCVCVCV